MIATSTKRMQSSSFGCCCCHIKQAKPQLSRIQPWIFTGFLSTTTGWTQQSCVFFLLELGTPTPTKKKRCFNHPCIHEVGVKLVALLKVLSCRASFWPNYSQSGTYWTSSTSISVGTKWSRNDKSDNTIDVTYTIEKKRKPSKHVYISIYFPGFIIWSYKKSTKDHPHPKAGNILMTSTFAEMSKPQISTKTKGETLGNQETMDLMLEMSIDRLRCLHD